MNILNKPDQDPQVASTEPIVAELTGEDSFLWVGEDNLNLTELWPSDPLIQPGTAIQQTDRSRRTLFQKILLTILPLMLVPIGAIALVEIPRMIKLQPKPLAANSSTPANQSLVVVDEYWWDHLHYLLALGGINFAAALWVARRMSSSFTQITTKLSEAANGNLSTKLELNDTVEFQALADNFNQLVANFNYTLQQQRLAAESNKLFSRISRIDKEALDPLAVYQVAISGVNQLLEADRVSIYRCDPDWMGVLLAQTASSEVTGEFDGNMYFAESPIELSRFQSGQSLTIDDLRKVQLSPHRQDFVKQMQIQSMMFVPIIADEKLVALLSVQQCSRVRAWASWEVEFCTQAAKKIGSTIEQITSFTAQSIQIRRTNLLSQAIQLQQSQGLTDLMTSILVDIRQEFNFDRVMILTAVGRSSGKITTCVEKSDCPELDEAAMTDYLVDRLQTYDGDSGQTDRNILPPGNFNMDEISLLHDMQVESSLIAPIFAEGRLLGLAVGQMCQSSTFLEKAEFDKFNAIASQLGLALDRGRSLAQQEINQRHKALLSTVSVQLRESLDRQAIFQTAIIAIREALGADRVLICEVGQTVAIIAETVTDRSNSILGNSIETAEFYGIQQVNYDETIGIIEDIYQAGLSPEFILTLEQSQVRANIVIPILIEDKFFGSVFVDMCHAPRIWQAVEIDLLVEITSQMGLVLTQAQLIEQREANAGQLQSLSNFTLQLRQSLKRSDILSTAVELIRQTLDLDRAVIFELDQNFSGKIAAESVIVGTLSILDQQIQDSCIKSAGYELGRITAIPDIYQAGLSDCHIQMLESYQVRANLAVPISIDGQLFGLLIGHQCHSTRTWKTGEISLFNQFATQLALALNQSVLIEQRETAAKRAQLLSAITVRLRQSLDRSEILAIALPEIREVFGFDRVSILVTNDEGEGTIIAESIRSPELSVLNTVFSAEHLAEIRDLGFAQGKITSIEDLHTYGLSESLTNFLLQIKMHSAVSTPIIIGGQLFGLITGSMSDQPRVWAEAETDMLLQLASQIGIALNQAQLVQQLEETSRQQAEYAISQQVAKESLQANAWQLLIQVDRISQGDLTIRAHVSPDEIGTIADSYNATVESLRNLVTGVKRVSREVVSATSANEISVAELSLEALQQSTDIGLALNRLQEMSRSIQLVVNNALIAESAVMESAQLVQAGDLAMNRTVEGILTIRNTVAETGKKVKRLGESSQKISKVVSLIGNFAAQTNLLALNASIEAARAGEEGRGFAVVAEEVRSLARQSAEATGEIEKLVASIQAETNDVVMAMEAGTEQVVIGTRLVDEARSSLNQITATSVKIGELVEAIAQAALLQAEDSNQVTQSIDRVADIASKTSVRADNVQASFQDLLKLSQELQTNVGQFKIE